MVNTTRVMDLGLELDHSRHVAKRGNRSAVDFGGQCRLWSILAALSKRYDLYMEKRDLVATVWDDYIPEDDTVFAAVSELRNLLRPLGLAITFKKGLGYRLATA